MEAGDELGLFGIQIEIDQEAKQVVITQPKQFDRFEKNYGRWP